MRSSCRRCGATLIDSTKPCGVCRADRIEAHVTTLVSSARSTDSAAIKARADAVTALRAFGFTQQQVVEARAKALDGYSVQEILRGLVGVQQVGAVAAA
jgi:Holliday junction resolvasome RuvABC DNA-binding subunit